MRYLLPLLSVLMLLLNSCATANIATTYTPDGKMTACEAYYFSLFKEMDVANMSACGGKGNSAGSKVNTVMAQELFKALISVP